MSNLRSMLVASMAAAALVSGCAAARPSPLGPDHPASARAPETPRPPASTALADDVGAASTGAAPDAPDGAHPAHAAHRGRR